MLGQAGRAALKRCGLCEIQARGYFWVAVTDVSRWPWFPGILAIGRGRVRIGKALRGGGLAFAVRRSLDRGDFTERSQGRNGQSVQAGILRAWPRRSRARKRAGAPWTRCARVLFSSDGEGMDPFARPFEDSGGGGGFVPGLGLQGDRAGLAGRGSAGKG